MNALRRLARFGINAEAVQISFTVGAIFGMLAMAFLLTVPKIAFGVLAMVRAGL